MWAPHLVCDIDSVESVQRKATKMIPGYSDISYEDRLRHRQLPTLVYRRARGDMINVYKYGTGIYKVNLGNLFEFSTDSNTRGNSLKLFKNFIYELFHS